MSRKLIALVASAGGTGICLLGLFLAGCSKPSKPEPAIPSKLSNVICPTNAAQHASYEYAHTVLLKLCMSQAAIDEWKTVPPDDDMRRHTLFGYSYVRDWNGEWAQTAVTGNVGWTTAPPGYRTLVGFTPIPETLESVEPHIRYERPSIELPSSLKIEEGFFCTRTLGQIQCLSHVRSSHLRWYVRVMLDRRVAEEGHVAAEINDALGLMAEHILSEKGTGDILETNQ